MTKALREFLARLLTGLWLFIAGATVLIGLTFNDLPKVLAVLMLLAGLAWLSTLLP